MRHYIKMYNRLSAKAGTVQGFRFVVGTLKRILGTPCPAASIEATDPDQFAMSYLAHELTRKAADINLMSEAERPNIPQGMDYDEWLLATTSEKFMDREKVNQRINESETFGWDPFTGEHLSDDTVGLNVLLRAREIVHEILGDAPPATLYGAFGNGASDTLLRRDAQREKKFLCGLTTTLACHQPAKQLLESSLPWVRSICPMDVLYSGENGDTGYVPPNTLKRVLGGVFDTVPKDAASRRVIIKEPTLNGFLQKGIGNAMRDRLRRYVYNAKVMLAGIDLNTSGGLNKGLAKAGSLKGHLATIDAKAASDSITLALCEFMFPPEWFNVLMQFRSPFIRIGRDRWHKVQMMSGMGNGSTFEMESVLFYAIGLASAERSSFPFAQYYVSIHGDDLVVPSDVSAAVFSAFERAGIEVNLTKTFVRGGFRESCGGHYYNGHDVTPFYIKRADGRSRGDFFWLHNSLLLWLNCRTEEFLASPKGMDLIRLCKCLKRYASNDTDIWYIGLERSLRSGLLGGRPRMTKGWPRSRCVVDVPDEATDLPEEGRYLVALCQPTRLLTVFEMCNHKSQIENEYETTTVTKERERWVTHYGWLDSAFLNCENRLT